MPLRWGIVSAGKISHDFVNSFNSYPDVGDQAIVAVAARDKSRAAEFAKLHNIPKVLDNYETLAKSQDIGKHLLTRRTRRTRVYIFAGHVFLTLTGHILCFHGFFTMWTLTLSPLG